MKRLRYIFLTLPFGLPFTAQAAEDNVWNIWRNTSGAVPEAGKTCNETNGGCAFNDIMVVALNILELLFKAGIFIAVIMIIYGAISMMIAGGSPEKIKKARQTMLYAVVGLIIVLATTLIVGAVQSVFQQVSIEEQQATIQ